MQTAENFSGNWFVYATYKNNDPFLTKCSDNPIQIDVQTPNKFKTKIKCNKKNFELDGRLSNLKKNSFDLTIMGSGQKTVNFRALLSKSFSEFMILKLRGSNYYTILSRDPILAPDLFYKAIQVGRKIGLKASKLNLLF
jgi:hypothetical protein